MAVDGGCERSVEHRMNEVYRAWEELKSVLSNIELGINAKSLNTRVIAPTALYQTQAWGMRIAKESECSRDKVFEKFGGISLMDIIRYETVRRRARIERELASRVRSESIEMAWTRGKNV